MQISRQSKDIIARTIQQIMADEYRRSELLKSCTVYAWLARKVCSEALGIDFRMVAGSCQWEDTEGFAVGWNAANGEYSFHAWLERDVEGVPEILDLTSCFWVEIAAMASSILIAPPPAYLWGPKAEINPSWIYTPVPGLEAHAEQVMLDQVEPLSQRIIRACKERLETNRP